MLKSPAVINSLLLSSKDGATDENSVIKAFIWWSINIPNN